MSLMSIICSRKLIDSVKGWSLRMMREIFSMEFVVNFFGTNKIEKNIEIDEEILDQVFKSSDEIFWYPEFPMNCDGFRYWFLGDWAQNCYYVSTRTLTNYSYEFLHEIQSLFSV